MSDPKQRKTILLLVAPLAIMPILFTYLVLQTPSSLMPDVSATSNEEDLYLNQIAQVVYKVESMSEKTSRFGSEVLISDFTVSEVVSEIEKLQAELGEEKLRLEELSVPSLYGDSHPYLVASIQDMYDSNELLMSAFQKFESVNEGKLPMFMITSYLGSEATSLPQLYNMGQINKEEKLLVESARNMFSESIKEASSVKNNFDIFISKSGINAKDVVLVESTKSFGRGGGCAACALTIDQINSNRTLAKS
jgi:hypothetical protein